MADKKSKADKEVEQQESNLAALTKRMTATTEEQQRKRENILGDEMTNLRKAFNFRKKQEAIEMASVKSAIDKKKKVQAAEEVMLLETANNLGVTVDELKSEYKSIKVNPDKISQLIFEPFDNLSKSLVEFEVGFGKNLSGASGAIKELTGGLIDLGQFAEDGADKVKAVGTLLATPFKLANTAVAKTTKIFTGNEINFGQKLQDWWSGTEEEIDGETKKSEGFKDRFLNSIPEAFQNFGKSMTGMKDGIKDGVSNFAQNTKNFVSGLVQGAKELPAKAFNAIKDFGGKMKEMGQGFIDGAKSFGAATKQFMMKSAAFLSGLAKTAMAMGRQAIAFIATLPALVMAGVTFVAGLIMSAMSMLIAAAPMIGIGLLIAAGVAAIVMGVMFLVQNFQSIKDTISEKVGGAIDKVKGFIQGFTQFFVDVWQSISDWVRGKILGIKKKLFGLSDEEQAELDAINDRKAEKKKAKDLKKEQEKLAEQSADEQYQAMLESGELEGKSRREKRKLKKQLEKDALADIQEEATFQAKSSEQLLKEKEQADATLQSLNFYEEDVARETRNNLAGSIKGADGEELTGDERERVAREFAEDKVAMDERRFGGTAMSAEERDELRIQASAASMRREMELGTREDYVEARILSQDEVDAIKAAAIGISKEDYQKAQEDPNYFQDSDAFSDEQVAKMSEAVQRAEGDRIKDARDRADEAAQMGPPAPPVNMATNAVQQVNVSNNRKVVSDPAPHNPDPTGSRLSVVPA